MTHASSQQSQAPSQMNNHIISNIVHRPPLFIVRMSAIGDTILAARTHAWVKQKGYAPYLITHKSNASLIDCMPQIAGACLMSDSGSVFLLREMQTGQMNQVEESEFLAHLKTAQSSDSGNQSSIWIADLQSTKRSRRAISEMQNTLSKIQLQGQVHKVRKLSFWRLLLVLWSFLARSQWQGRKPPVWLRNRLKAVHQLQKELIEKIPNSPATLRPDATVPVLTTQQGTTQAPNEHPESSVVLLLGSSYRLKSWPREHFRKLIDLIITRTDLRVVLCGGPDDLAVSEYLAFAHPQRIKNLVGQTSLAETLTIIQKARYVVTGDSFASHAADLLGTPVSVLFGATHPLLGFAPEGHHTTVHHAELSCSPCSRHGQGECRFRNIRCLTSITPEEVFSKLEQKVNQRRQANDANPPNA